VTQGETLYLALALATFVSFAIMLAYHDHQYRATKRRATSGSVATRGAAPDGRAHA